MYLAKKIVLMIAILLWSGIVAEAAPGQWVELIAVDPGGRSVTLLVDGRECSKELAQDVQVMRNMRKTNVAALQVDKKIFTDVLIDYNTIGQIQKIRGWYGILTGSISAIENGIVYMRLADGVSVEPAPVVQHGLITRNGYTVSADSLQVNDAVMVYYNHLRQAKYIEAYSR
jgi:hypothetical protein